MCWCAKKMTFLGKDDKSIVEGDFIENNVPGPSLHNLSCPCFSFALIKTSFIIKTKKQAQLRLCKLGPGTLFLMQFSSPLLHYGLVVFA